MANGNIANQLRRLDYLMKSRTFTLSTSSSPLSMARFSFGIFPDLYFTGELFTLRACLDELTLFEVYSDSNLSAYNMPLSFGIGNRPTAFEL